VAVAAATAGLAWAAPRGPAGGAPAAAPTPGDEPDSADRPKATLMGDFVGSSSCAGRGCHGAVTKVGTVGSEFSTWHDDDEHARAYDVLLDPRSKVIEANLDPDGKYKGLVKWDAQGKLTPEALATVKAEQDGLCLKCHNLPDATDGGRSAATAAQATGVGCESCHGPARKWLETHYHEDFQKLTADQKHERYGLVALDTAERRAGACVACHVGDATKEVNHDLIAAGHPRLNFELATFLADMPEHWNAADVAKAHGPISEAQTWAVGQVATARAFAELTAARSADADRPWPEFTEYACYACHHDLAGNRPQYRAGKSKPGTFLWNSWGSPLAIRLAEARGDTAVHDGMVALTDAMNRLAPPRADVTPKAQAAAKALEALEAALKTKPFTAANLKALVGAAVATEDSRAAATANWDAAAQLYLAAVVLANESKPDPATTKALAALADRLGFPADRDSPGVGFDPEKVRAAFAELAAAPLLKLP